MQKKILESAMSKVKRLAISDPREDVDKWLVPPRKQYEEIYKVFERQSYDLDVVGQLLRKGEIDAAKSVSKRIILTIAAYQYGPRGDRLISANMLAKFLSPVL